MIVRTRASTLPCYAAGVRVGKQARRHTNVQNLKYLLSLLMRSRVSCSSLPCRMQSNNADEVQLAGHQQWTGGGVARLLSAYRRPRDGARTPRAGPPPARPPSGVRALPIRASFERVSSSRGAVWRWQWVAHRDRSYPVADGQPWQWRSCWRARVRALVQWRLQQTNGSSCCRRSRTRTLTESCHRWCSSFRPRRRPCQGRRSTTWASSC